MGNNGKELKEYLGHTPFEVLGVITSYSIHYTKLYEGDINNINVHATSHQAGHILAALFSCNKLDLINEPFIAFHVSGGTTDCLLRNNFV